MGLPHKGKEMDFKNKNILISLPPSTPPSLSLLPPISPSTPPSLSLSFLPSFPLSLPLLFAHSLGVETVDRDVMNRPPRKASEPIINLQLITQVSVTSLTIVCGTLWVFWKEVSIQLWVQKRKEGQWMV